MTPMQLEEDLEYRFPSSVSSTPMRSSPLVVPISLLVEEGENEGEMILEMSTRSR